LKFKFSYKEGKEDGIWVGYFENGELNGREVYRNGVKIE
jgi:antitoxin component YwqK of YwqJK toxin-antitoxin module